MCSLEFDELRQLLKLDGPSGPASSAPPTLASASGSDPASAISAPASAAPSSSFSASATSTADLDLDKELAALELSHAELQELLADSGPDLLPARSQEQSWASSSYTPAATQPLRITKMSWDRPIAAPREDVLEGVNDLTEEEARALAKELGLDDEDIEEAIVTNQTVKVPLGPSPGEVPLLAESMKGSGAGPVVDEAEFLPPPSDDSGPPATHGQLSPSKPAPVPLGPTPDASKAPARSNNTDTSISPVETPTPVMHDPTELPKEVVAEAIDVPGDAPVVDEAEFKQPEDAGEGPGPVTGQLTPAKGPASPEKVISLSEISPVPQKPAPATAPPPPLEPLPSAEAVSVAEEGEDEREVMA